MKLPHRENAFAPKEKITEYLLAESHPVGGPKAKFFRAFGFDESNVQLFEQALLELARSEEVRQVKEGERGTKYVLSGEINTPIGRTVIIETVWMIERNENNPRFITAYPA